MNIDELLFNKAYNIETCFLQHAWNAQKALDFNRRDKCFERAVKARPKIYPDDIVSEEWEQEVIKLFQEKKEKPE